MTGMNLDKSLNVICAPPLSNIKLTKRMQVYIADFSWPCCMNVAYACVCAVYYIGFFLCTHINVYISVLSSHKISARIIKKTATNIQVSAIREKSKQEKEEERIKHARGGAAKAWTQTKPRFGLARLPARQDSERALPRPPPPETFDGNEAAFRIIIRRGLSFHKIILLLLFPFLNCLVLGAIIG